MSMNFPKGQRAVAFDRATAFPLDANAYFESLASAQAAALTAEEVGSKNSAYYFGQVIAVVADDIATLYIIEKDGEEGETKGKGILKEVGSKTLGDGKSIDLEDGVLSLHGFKNAENNHVPYMDLSDVNNPVMKWGPVSGLIPNTITTKGDDKTISVSLANDAYTVSMFGATAAANETVFYKGADGNFSWVPSYTKSGADSAIASAVGNEANRAEAAEAALNTAVIAAHNTANAAVVANADLNAGEFGTYTKITFDKKGLVTKGESLSASDIPELAQSKITGLSDSLANKQDTLAFEGTYDKSTNKVVTKSVLDDAVKGLSGAMHFVGRATAYIIPGSTIDPEITGYDFSKKKNGDVILGKSPAGTGEEDYSNAEFVWDGAKWEILGDQTHYAVKGAIVDADIAAAAAINQSKIANLTSDLAGKANKVSSATSGHFASLDSNGDLADSGKSSADFATNAQGALADSALQEVSIAGVDLNKTNHTISADTLKTQLGLKSAAYEDVNAFATNAQGAKADSAIQGVKVNGANLTPDSSKFVDVLIAEGSANGAISVNNIDVNVKGLKSAAFSNASDFASSEQGAKADSAVQAVSIATGDVNGEIKLTVDGSTSNVAVKGLGGAAFAEVNAFASAAQGVNADSAIQTLKIAGVDLNKTSNELTVDTIKTNLGLGSAAYEDKTAFDAAGAAANQAANIIGKSDDNADQITIYGARAYAVSVANTAASAVQGNTTNTVADVVNAANSLGNDLANHVNDSVKHITTSERTSWNAEIGAYNAANSVSNRVTILEGNDSVSGSVVNTVTMASVNLIGKSTDASTANTIYGAKKHAEEKAAAAANDAVNTVRGGSSKTIKEVEDDINGLSSVYAAKSYETTIDNHIANEVMHITAAERTAWNAEIGAFNAANAASSAVNTEKSRAEGAEAALSNSINAIIDSKGSANGIATLDANNKVPLGQLPDVILGQLTFGGTFDGDGIATISEGLKSKLGIEDATIQLTNLATDVKTKTPKEYGYKTLEGVYFLADATFTIAEIEFQVGDWLVSIGTAWKKIDNTDAVTSVNGRTGAVVINAADVNLGNVANLAPNALPISDAAQATFNVINANVSNIDARVTTIEGKPCIDITSTQISAWDSASNDSHTHSNKTVLDGINSALINQWNKAEENVINAISINGTEIAPTNKVVALPLATSSALGLVQGDNDTIALDANGVISVAGIYLANTFIQKTDEIILNGGTA